MSVLIVATSKGGCRHPRRSQSGGVRASSSLTRPVQSGQSDEHAAVIIEVGHRRRVERASGIISGVLALPLSVVVDWSDSCDSVVAGWLRSAAALYLGLINTEN